jgi:hypothetical protein
MHKAELVNKNEIRYTKRNIKDTALLKKVKNTFHRKKWNHISSLGDSRKKIHNFPYHYR